MMRGRAMRPSLTTRSSTFGMFASRWRKRRLKQAGFGTLRRRLSVRLHHIRRRGHGSFRAVRRLVGQRLVPQFDQSD
jgi:hypothetical protein